MPRISSRTCTRALVDEGLWNQFGYLLQMLFHIFLRCRGRRSRSRRAIIRRRRASSRSDWGSTTTRSKMEVCLGRDRMVNFARMKWMWKWNPHLPVFSSQPGQFSLQLLFTSLGSIKGECSQRKVRPVMIKRMPRGKRTVQGLA